MQLRDYPHPLLDITGITITGRMMFAEQEAQERGQIFGTVRCDHMHGIIVHNHIFITHNKAV